MTDKQIKLVVSALLHDIGKVVYRSGDGRNHSQSGYEFLRDVIHIDDSDILNPVRYHHGSNLRNAGILDNDSSYIVYVADNIAAAVDRREKGDGEGGFDREVPLDSVFNILNGNNGKLHYGRKILNPEQELAYPTDEPIKMEDAFYRDVIEQLKDAMKGIEWTEDFVNSLLMVLEANLSYVPSSTSQKELTDISLYDHVKITAAVASCIEQVIGNESNLKSKLFEKAEEFYDERAFILLSMDISGIQKFIYTISSKGAMKALRARSFYLEIMMEHIIDELLDRTNLSRANLIYSGGGHCYVLMPNTDKSKEIIGQMDKEINQWFLDNFDISLFIGVGYAECSANELKNKTKGSYAGIYQRISEMISYKKAHRYTAADILKLNGRKHEGERECVVCHRSDHLGDGEKCSICLAIENMSNHIQNDDFFVVKQKGEDGALPLPFDCCLFGADEKKAIDIIQSKDYVRIYTKNRFYTGKFVANRLWIGDYSAGNIDDLLEKSVGIERIGVLRADVDNMGEAFVNGFNRNGDERYSTLSRTATMSRQLSLFFKLGINKILSDGDSGIFSDNKKRSMIVVYAGGDDLFLVGTWNDCLDAFIDIRQNFMKFAQGTLTISGGIGIYNGGFPIHVMASDTEALEEYSKNLEGKDGITLFDETGRYKWNVFLEKVFNEKYRTIRRFFQASKAITDAEYGKAFLYRLLELLRNSSEVINRARYVYLLSRMEPSQEASSEIREEYRIFAEQMNRWYGNNTDREQLITAIYLYVYQYREKDEREEESICS